jgi:hypothetical protein
MNRTGLQTVRVVIAYALAAGVGYVVAVSFATTANLVRLSAVGAEISVGDAWRTLLFDLFGMGPTPLIWTNYGSLIFIGFAIAFPVAALLRSQAARAQSAVRRVVPFLYPAAGATAIAVVLIGLYSQYEVVGVAGARGVLGFTAQLLAGVIAGYLFQRSIYKSEK